MMSKCGKNISDTLGYASCATFLFLPYFDVICDLFLNRRTATWNLFCSQELVQKCPCIPGSNWNLKMLAFKEMGKSEYPEKNLSEQSGEPTTNSTHI